MLQEMRKYSKSWIANVFLGVLALSFVSWGVGDMVSGRTDTSVAKVGGKAIDQQEFRRDYQNAMKRVAASRGEQSITDDEAKKMGLPNSVIESEISTTAVDNAAKQLGLTVSDAQVGVAIQRIPSFSGLTGQFDRRVFQQAIERFGYSEQGFIELIRSEIARGQLTQAVESGFTLPPGYARMLFSYFFETRAADYIVVDDKALGPIATPPDATLQAYVKAHADRFSTPEYRDVTFAYLTPADVAAQVKIGDDLIKQAYEQDKSTYVIAEKRDVEQLLFASEGAAKAAFDKARSGTKFEDIVNEKGEKPAAQPALTPDDLDAAAAKAVFAVAGGAVVAPQKLPSGKWALIKVTAITPGVNRTLDQVKEEIRAKLTKDAAIAKLTDISNAYTDASSAGLNLIDAGKKVGMHTGRVTAMDAQGLGPDGQKVVAPDDPEFRTMVFATEAGEEGDPQATKEGNIYVVSVSGSTPPKLKPLDQVRERALAGWMGEERARLLKQKAQDLTAQANREGSLDGAARAVGASIQKSPAFQHNFTDDTFSQQLVNALFQVGPNKAAMGPRTKNGGYVIAKITGIVHPQMPEKSPQYLMILRQLEQQVSGTLSESYTAQLRDDQKVTYNKKVMDSVLGGAEQ